MQKNIKLKGQIKTYLRWPLLLSILMVVMNLFIYMISWKAGIVLSGFTLIYILISMLLFFSNRSGIIKEMVNFAENYNHAQREAFENGEIPYVIIDIDGKLLWYNNSFSKMIDFETFHPKNISYFLPKLTKNLLQKTDIVQNMGTSINEREYSVSIKKLNLSLSKENEMTAIENEEGDSTYLIGLSFYDVTDLKRYIKLIEDEKMIAGWIYLDNYYEALADVEEVKRSMLGALIDRKITKQIENIDGICRKIEKDRYFIIFRKKFLEKLMNEKFPMLEDVKTINIGNSMPITLSIGIGVNGDSYAQNAEYARTAVDLALGRGGDQAVIKNQDDIFFYGGKSQSVEKNTKVRARVKAQALREIIGSREKVMVMGHKNGDVDCFGSAIGVYIAASYLQKKVYIVINDATTQIENLKSYFKDEKIYPENLFINNEQALDIIDANTTLVVVDVNKPSYTECPDLLERTKTVVVLDHHRQGKEVIKNASLSYVEPYASSACEMIAEILQYFSDGIKIRSHEADCIYAGIMVDTNNFMSKTGVRTFEAAAYLRRCGVDVSRVRKMFRNDMTAYKARAEAIRSAEVFKNVFAIAVCPSEDLDSPTIVGAQVANELLNIVGIKASIVLTDYKNKIYVSARSIDEINVQLIMERLGGGGHMNMAGTQFSNSSIEKVKKLVCDTIKKMMEEGDIK